MAVDTSAGKGWCCHSLTASSVWAVHFLKTPSSLCSTSILVMSKRHLGRFGHVSWLSDWPKERKTAFSSDIGRWRGRVDARSLVCSRYCAGSWIKWDWSLRAARIASSLPSMGFPVGPRRLRRCTGFFGSGAGTSPRRTARLSC